MVPLDVPRFGAREVSRGSRVKGASLSCATSWPTPQRGQPQGAVPRGGPRRRCCAECGPNGDEPLALLRVGEEAEGAQPGEVAGQDVLEEAADEDAGVEAHDLRGVAVGVVLVAEGDGVSSTATSTTTTIVGARSTASSNRSMRRRPRLSLCSFLAMRGALRCRRSSRASRCMPPRG